MNSYQRRLKDIKLLKLRLEHLQDDLDKKQAVVFGIKVDLDPSKPCTVITTIENLDMSLKEQHRWNSSSYQKAWEAILKQCPYRFGKSHFSDRRPNIFKRIMWRLSK